MRKPVAVAVCSLGLVWAVACGQDLETSGLLSAKGWPLEAACEPQSPYCGEPPPPAPPPRPPGVPLAVRYPSYSSRSAYTVSWLGEGDGGDSFELEERAGSGEWRRLYQGSGLSIQVSGRAAALYGYRVRACNPRGCGPFVTGPVMVVNPPPVLNLYPEYPFLHAHDIQNVDYVARTQGFRAALSAEPFVLGQGYNGLKELPARVCLETSAPGFRIGSQPLPGQTLDITRAVDADHLRRLLDVELSGDVTLGGEGALADASGQKRRLAEVLGDSARESVVVRWEETFDRWALEPEAPALKPDFVTRLLVPGNVNAQNKFRERCGDGYVQAVTRGARLYLVFQFDAGALPAEERDAHALALTAQLQALLSTQGAGSVSEPLRTLLEQLRVEVRAFTMGGEASVESGIGRDNFPLKFQTFLRGAAVHNAVVVEQGVRPYALPAPFADRDYYQVFADARPALGNLRRWNALDVERHQRCERAAAHAPDARFAEPCAVGRQELETAKSRCLETLSWSACRHPLLYTTGNGSGGLPPATPLHGWLGQTLPVLESASATRDVNHHSVGDWWSQACESFLDDTCLPAAACMADRQRGKNRGEGRGFEHVEHWWHGPGASTRSHDLAVNREGLTCVRTQGTLCANVLGDSSADYQFTQTLFGQCPRQVPFVLPP